MNNSTKTAIACAATYAFVGLNTFGYKYHHPAIEDLPGLDAIVAGILWPGYWAVHATIKVWEPNVVTVTNTVYTTLVVTNYVERPNLGHMTLPDAPANPLPYTVYPSLVWSNSIRPTNFVSTNSIKFYLNGSNITYVH